MYVFFPVLPFTPNSLEEQPLTLEIGLPGADYTIQSNLEKN